MKKSESNGDAGKASDGQGTEPGRKRAKSQGEPEPSFEDRLRRLEEISDKIRSSEIPLEQAAKFFEEGIRLARGLEKDLGRIERKIEILVNDPGDGDEKPVLELFPELTDPDRDA